jgi:hypothetical protein
MQQIERLDAFDVDGAFPLLAVLHLKCYEVSLHQRVTKPGALHIALVKEDIITVFDFNEAKSFCNIEQLHSTLHEKLLYSIWKQESPSDMPGRTLATMNTNFRSL